VNWRGCKTWSTAAAFCLDGAYSEEQGNIVLGSRFSNSFHEAAELTKSSIDRCREVLSALRINSQRTPEHPTPVRIPPFTFVPPPCWVYCYQKLLELFCLQLLYTFLLVGPRPFLLRGSSFARFLYPASSSLGTCLVLAIFHGLNFNLAAPSIVRFHRLS
jgi:hypothetical protein